MLDNFFGSWIVYARILTLIFVKNFRLGFENRIFVKIRQKYRAESKSNEKERERKKSPSQNKYILSYNQPHLKGTRFFVYRRSFPSHLFLSIFVSSPYNYENIIFPLKKHRRSGELAWMIKNQIYKIKNITLSVRWNGLSDRGGIQAGNGSNEYTSQSAQ